MVMETMALSPLLRLCLSLIGLSHLVVTLERACGDLQVKDILKNCNPDLAAINTAILQTTDRDFSYVCSSFSMYINCVEPEIMGCESILLETYRQSCSVYTSLPYNCTVPYINVTETDYHTMHQTSSAAAMPQYWTLCLITCTPLLSIWIIYDIWQAFH